MSRQRIWSNHISSVPIILPTMHHDSPSISLQPESENQSSLKTPALQLLLSDVTAPSPGHIHTTHEMHHMLHSSEWDVVQQLQPAITQVDMCTPDLFPEQQMAVCDYLSCLLPSADDQQGAQLDLCAADGDATLKRRASTHLTSHDERSECELSKLPVAQHDESIERCTQTSSEAISAGTLTQDMHTEGCKVMKRELGGAEWISVPIRQTVVPASRAALPPAKAAHSGADTRPKLRFSKGASASKYCHICGRNSKTVAVAQCANVVIGLCRKVVCEKCLMLHREEIGLERSTPGAEWKCTHCEGVCPKRARCHQYTKNNLRRRMKNDCKQQRRKAQDLTRKRAERLLEERERNFGEVQERDDWPKCEHFT